MIAKLVSYFLPQKRRHLWTWAKPLEKNLWNEALERGREKKSGVHDLHDASINVVDVDCRWRFMIYFMIYQINRRTASSLSRVTIRSMFFPQCPTGPSSLINFQRQDTTKLVARSAQDLASYCKNAELDESQLGFETWSPSPPTRWAPKISFLSRGKWLHKKRG